MSKERLRKYIENDITYQDYKMKKPIPQYLKLHTTLCEDIENVLEENQQLKEELKLVEALTCFNMPNNTPMVCMFKADYERNKYEYETLDKYKSVLDEIREYIENNKRITGSYFNGKEYEYTNYELVCEPNDILQILDKVKE